MEKILDSLRDELLEAVFEATEETLEGLHCHTILSVVCFHDASGKAKGTRLITPNDRVSPRHQAIREGVSKLLSDIYRQEPQKREVKVPRKR